MSKYLQRRFPHRIEDIDALSKKDATFREICSDYEEASAWLDVYCHSEDLSPIKRDRYRELMGELEGEIIDALREAAL